MRSVPHRVVCLLGLDDGAFPRKAPRDGDDLLLRDPHVGDRDARTEDRQLLLDALMAATDRLIVTYTGNDERTNVAAPAGGAGRGAAGRGRATRTASRRSGTRCSRSTRATSSRGARAGQALELRPGDARGRAVAGRARAPRRRRSWPAPLPPREPRPLELADLVRFVEHPVRAFLRQRLGISVGDYSDEVADALPVELDAPREVGRRPAAARRGDRRRRGPDGDPGRDRRAASSRPASSACPVVQSIWQAVDEIAGQARALIAGEAGVGRRQARRSAGGGSTGTVPGVRGDVADHRHVLEGQPAPPARPRGCGCWRCCAAGGAYSAVDDRPGQRGVRAGDGGADAGAAGRRTRGGARGPARPLRPRDARAAAAGLPDVGGVRRGGNPRGEWESDRFPKEDRDAEHELVHGPAHGVRRAAGGCARVRTSAGIRPSRRASASTRCGCGGGCSRVRR